MGMVCTEFVRISRGPLSQKALSREVVRAPGVPLCVQVMGNDLEKMAEAAGWMAAWGADVVDINLGCPAPRAVRHGVGSAMLRDPRLLFEVVRAMRAAVPGVLSAKMRAGFEESKQVLALASVLVDAGIDFLTVHPRRRVDFYEGVADWRIIRTLVETLPIPVVGNGDCWYADDALRMMEETGCAAVMIGRPALRNPWIFRQVGELLRGESPYAPSGIEVADWLETTAGRYAEWFGARGKSSLGKLKELTGWMTRALPPESHGRQSVLRAPSTETMVDAFRAAFEPWSAEALDLQANGSFRLERSGSTAFDPVSENNE